MFKDTKVFISFSVPDLEKAKEFYSKTLGLKVVEILQGIELHIAGGTVIFIYPSTNYKAPEHTILNFPVDDIEKAVDELNRRGVKMEQYDTPDFKTDEKGICRMEGGPKGITWFKDPADHILALIQEK